MSVAFDGYALRWSAQTASANGPTRRGSSRWDAGKTIRAWEGGESSAEEKFRRICCAPMQWRRRRHSAHGAPRTRDCVPKLIDKFVGLLLAEIPLKYSERESSAGGDYHANEEWSFCFDHRLRARASGAVGLLGGDRRNDLRY